MTQTLPFDPVVEPPEVMPTVYGPPPQADRGRDLPGLVSIRTRELFPDIPVAPYRGGDDTAAVRRAAEAALAHVDMSMILPAHTVNVLCSEHGFGMLGGQAYVEMLTTVKDEIQRRTGCRNVRLVVIAWLGAKESDELVEYYELDRRFDGRVRGVTPMDQGIPIETAMGTLYGLRKVYDGDWIIHAHYDDPREVYVHRAIDRITKPFGMSYARMETRSIFHITMGPRSGNFIGRAIADSEFVRSKLAFTTTLVTSPDGVLDVDADNDLNAIGNRMTANILRSYGKMLTLLRAVGDCVAVIDGAKWPYYIHAGGMIFGHLFYNAVDWFDLDRPDADVAVEKAVAAGFSKSLKGVVLNQALIGLNFTSMAMLYPLVIANPEMAAAMRHDFSNPMFLDHALVAENLFQAVEMAVERAGTDRVIVFDGSYGSLNVSPSMATHLRELAPEAARLVDEELLPKWLKQRGIDPLMLA
ncbi:hypothetical protein [Cryptosporangium aurantiacum]|uniref:Uncharacterized protein n=1 Tax=Cryptosporangium aurantiacum TaxID=134849 RepID=A0A1M7PFN7_9ACTN|nr:hypothetical protein [Cryptosporangium aurantiacum]SHN15516.1 hypothetical protein SAMN05443668_103283 [Cryptosporangium aurantiacum]